MMFAKIDVTQNKLLEYPCLNWTDAYKHVSFPLDLSLMSDEDLLSFSMVHVATSAKPSITDAQIVNECGPRLQNGVWTQQWVVSDIPASVLQQRIDSAKAQLKEQMLEAIQQRLDAFAKQRGYDGILSACTYATSAVAKFKVEGQRCVDLRDATWAASYDILAKVQAGQRSMPSGFSEIESELPALTWPA
ncbi:hypothetical protein [Limnohabitans sp.]|uniref:hypothetical protein n=1 Tax=Limnohabitans sp. TaxID=1907725 RepID=UPI00286ED6ED|nr:hypothetical protein [Limnohabitans sp.]